MNSLWTRVKEGQHTVVVGLPPAAPPSDLSIRAIRVACDRHGGPLQPIREAQEKADAVVGWPVQLLGNATERLRRGLRESLLGERHTPDDADLLAQSLSRLARQSPRRHVLIFDAADALSPQAASVLLRLMRVPRLLSVPVVLSARQVVPGSPFAILVEQLVTMMGNEMLIETQPMASAEHGQETLIRALPGNVVETLRTAALIGVGFEAEVLASAMGLPLYEVLLRLQAAVDAKIALDDSEDGVFHMEAGLQETLLKTLLPSLRRMMHLKIAAVLTYSPQQSPENDRNDPLESMGGRTVEVPFVEEQEETTKHPIDTDLLTEEDEKILDRVWAEHADQDNAQKHNEQSDAGEPVDPGRSEAAQTTADTASPGRFVPRGADSGSLTFDGPKTLTIEDVRPGHQGRAAEHLVAGGDDTAAVTQFIEAAQRALFMGSPSDGMVYSQRAVALLEGMTPSPPRQKLRAEALLLLAQAQLDAPAHNGKVGLADALDTVSAALVLFEAAEDSAKVADALALSARIHYEIGDSESTETALLELTRAIELRAASGDPVGAARLLNDQASVFLRLGDPVRAYRLLEQSRETFAARANDDPVAMVELAETEHLIARLPLHVAARAGREDDSVRMGLEHAELAHRRYTHLGMDREAARVWETMGRLQLMGGKTADAVTILEQALRIQIELGDVMGMARTVEALASALAAEGQIAAAMDLLAESVELNLVKGSPRGIAYLNTTFQKVIDGLTASQQESLADRIVDLKQHLAVAADLIADDLRHTS